MKYLIYILILVSLAFSQDVYRLNDSTFVYPCIGDSTGLLNFVGLPVQTDFINASDFDLNGDNVNSISVFNASEQKWMTAGYHPALGWGTDFPVETGSAYMLNAVNNFDFTVTGDSVDVTYDLVTTPGADNNHIVHPLTKSNLASLSEIGDDIGTENCYVVNKWDNVTQAWSGTVYNVMFERWLGDYNSQPGKPLSVIMTDNLTWPTLEKNENYRNLSSDKKVTSKVNNSGPKVVYFNIIDKYTTGEAIPIEDARMIQFRAWITVRESEILSEEDYGCGITEINGYSVAYVNVGNFPTDWASDETLYISFGIFDTDEPTSCSTQIDDSHSPLYCGFEPLIEGSGLPTELPMGWIIAPSGWDISINQVGENQIELSWGWDFMQRFYHIYSSEQPYGTFNYITTTQEFSWTTEADEDRKFFYTTWSYVNKNIPKTIFVKQEK